MARRGTAVVKPEPEGTFAMRVPWSALGVAFALSACGPTVGDACTTNNDCGGATCLQGATTPGGYCTTSCQGGGNCPNGSACVQLSGQGNSRTCLLLCTAGQQCRAGYTCDLRDGARVCLGP